MKRLLFCLASAALAFSACVASADYRTGVDELTVAAGDDTLDNNVRNGISCMSCHDTGMKAEHDEVIDGQGGLANAAGIVYDEDLHEEWALAHLRDPAHGGLPTGNRSCTGTGCHVR